MIWDIVAAIVIAWLVIMALPWVFAGAVWVIIALMTSSDETRPRTATKLSPARPINKKSLLLALVLWGFLIAYFAWLFVKG